jgi:hypothetical protein
MYYTKEQDILDIMEAAINNHDCMLKIIAEKEKELKEGKKVKNGWTRKSLHEARLDYENRRSEANLLYIKIKAYINSGGK